MRVCSAASSRSRRVGSLTILLIWLTRGARFLHCCSLLNTPRSQAHCTSIVNT